MTTGIHGVCLSGTCRYCRQAVGLHGISGGSLGPKWDKGWRTRPGTDENVDARLCLARMELAKVRFRPPTGIGHQPYRASIELRSAHGDSAGEAGGISTTRYAVMQKPPVWLFLPAGLLITGVPVGVEPAEVQAELVEASARGGFLLGSVGAFMADVGAGERHEIIAGTEQRFGEIREDQVRVIDWERLVAAAQARHTLIRHDWQDLRTGGLPGLERRARAHLRARADRKRRIRMLQP